MRVAACGFAPFVADGVVAVGLAGILEIALVFPFGRGGDERLALRFVIAAGVLDDDSSRPTIFRLA